MVFPWFSYEHSIKPPFPHGFSPDFPAQDELRLAGERLHYRLLRGAGPPEGGS